VSVLSPPLAPLLASQHQELGIGGQNFPHRVLKFPPRLDVTADVLDPVLGNMLDVLLAVHHKCERPEGVSLLVLDAVAGGLAAAQMRKREGTGEQIVGKLETPHQLELALAESRSLRTAGFIFHLMELVP